MSSYVVIRIGDNTEPIIAFLTISHAYQYLQRDGCVLPSLAKFRARIIQDGYADAERATHRRGRIRIQRLELVGGDT